MAFNMPFFLFLFLPIILFVGFLVPKRFLFAAVLVSSLLFYWWAEPVFIFAALAITLWGFWIAYRIGKSGDNEKVAKRWLVLGVGSNVLGLLIFKVLPYQFTGISFLIFLILAYLFDVYNQLIQPEKNIWKFIFHTFFFPKVVSGPIMRYEQTSGQLDDLHINIKKGVIRFIIGLAKKVLLADQLGIISDGIFNLSTGTITPSIAWVGALCYTLQIYYDFSGYSDMAIGLGHFFGFNIPENFNYPYLATSISDFWRRWHITLSNWFRDYVFLPLEFSRRHSSLKWLQYINILIVFSLTGLWHGLDWTFLLWGLLHGTCISLETMYKKKYNKIPQPIQRLYTLLILVVGWILFRSPSIPFAIGYLKAMVGIYRSESLQPLLSAYISSYNIGLMVIGVIFAIPILTLGKKYLNIAPIKFIAQYGKVIEVITILIIFAYSLLAVAASTYQAFIYFQF